MFWFKRSSLVIRLQLAMMVSWVLLYWAASILEYSPHASLWYPPAALSFAALLLLGPAILPALLLVVGLMSTLHVIKYQPAESTLYIAAILPALAHAISYLVGTLILRGLILSKKVLYIGTVVAFLILAAASSFLAAFTGSWALNIAHVISSSERQAIWLSWWIGDLVAILSLSPLFLLILDKVTTNKLAAIAQDLFKHGKGPFTDYFLKLVVCLFMLLISMLLAHHVRAIEITFIILFLSVPAMWLVYTESFWRSFSGLALISVTIVILMAALNLDEYAAVYQFTIAMIAVSMLYGSVVPLLLNTNQQLQQSLQTDPLTGVLSRQGFIEQADLILAHARRRKDQLCFAVLDLDHFKLVNDLLGHDTGDKVLQQVCTYISSHLRDQDLFGRFGGDEFMLLLPDTRVTEALALCERLRQGIASLNIKVENQIVTLSCGICVVATDETFSQCFARADQNLLQAKHAGRNQVVFANAAAF